MNPTNIEPVTEAELARVLELDAKATQGPWEMRDDYIVSASATIKQSHHSEPVPTPVIDVMEAESIDQSLIVEYRTITPRLARELAAARAAIKVKDEALTELLKLRKNCEGDIGWRGRPSAIVDNIRVKHILLIESALNTHTHE